MAPMVDKARPSETPASSRQPKSPAPSGHSPPEVNSAESVSGAASPGLGSQETDGQDRATQELWRAVIDFALSARSRWMAICAELDLTPAQGHALRALDPEQPVAMSALADALVCDASNVTGIVDKLELRGLILRQGAEHDRRVKQLIVTERGRELRARLTARMYEAPAALANLPRSTKLHLTALLRAAIMDRPRST